MDKEKVLDYVMNSPGNSNRAVLSGMLDESNEKSNDFSTATLIINGDTTGMIDLYAALACFEYIEGADCSGYIGGGIGVDQGATIILYKGKAYAAIIPDSGVAVNVSGNIAHISGVNYVITGDCTITLSEL